MYNRQQSTATKPKVSFTGGSVDSLVTSHEQHKDSWQTSQIKDSIYHDDWMLFGAILGIFCSAVTRTTGCSMVAVIQPTFLLLVD